MGCLWVRISGGDLYKVGKDGGLGRAHGHPDPPRGFRPHLLARRPRVGRSDWTLLRSLWDALAAPHAIAAPQATPPSHHIEESGSLSDVGPWPLCKNSTFLK